MFRKRVSTEDREPTPRKRASVTRMFGGKSAESDQVPVRMTAKARLQQEKLAQSRKAREEEDRRKEEIRNKERLAQQKTAMKMSSSSRPSRQSPAVAPSRSSIDKASSGSTRRAPAVELEAPPRKNLVANGIVSVKIVGAQNLVAKNADTRSSDVFVAVLHGNDEHHTKVIESSLEPVWNETFQFPFVETEDICFYVYDDNYGGQPDPMGRVMVSPDSVTSADQLWLPLTNTSHGQICVEITPPSQFLALQKHKQTVMAAAPTKKSGGFEEGALKVAVLKGKNLMMKDPKQFINAFVKITLGNEEYSTEAKSGSLSPSWDEVYGMVLPEGQHQLKFEIFHRTKQDTVLPCGIAVVEVPTRDMQKRPGQPTEMWISTQKKEMHGELLVELTYQPASWLLAQGIARQPQGPLSSMSSSKKLLHKLLTKKGVQDEHVRLFLVCSKSLFDGTKILDQSGFSNHGRLVCSKPGDLWEPVAQDPLGVVGALSDTANLRAGEYFEVKPTSSLDVVQQFTLEVWAKPESLNSGFAVFQKGKGGFPYFESKHLLAYLRLLDDQLVAEVDLLMGAKEHRRGINIDLTAQWCHYAMTYDGEELCVYLNGELEFTAYNRNLTEVKTDTTNPLIIGRSDEPPYSTDYIGNIAGVRLTDIALTPSVVKTRMFDLKEGKTSFKFKPKERASLGTLKLRLVRGENFVIRDRKEGSSDPFAEIFFGVDNCTSRVVENSLNPVWNEDFEFTVFEDPTELEIDVWDHNLRRSVISMGSGSVEIRSSDFANRRGEVWVSLGKAKYGRVLVEVEFTPNAPPEEDKQQKRDLEIRQREMTQKLERERREREKNERQRLEMQHRLEEERREREKFEKEKEQLQLQLEREKREKELLDNERSQLASKLDQERRERAMRMHMFPAYDGYAHSGYEGSLHDGMDPFERERRQLMNERLRIADERRRADHDTIVSEPVPGLKSRKEDTAAKKKPTRPVQRPDTAGLLKLTVLAARNASSSGAAPNFRVRATLADVNFMTPTCKDPAHPKWDTTFEFVLEKDQEELFLELFDDPFGDDDDDNTEQMVEVGFQVLDIPDNELRSSKTGQTKRWVQLENGNAGELLVKLEYEAPKKKSSKAHVTMAEEDPNWVKKTTWLWDGQETIFSPDGALVTHDDPDSMWYIDDEGSIAVKHSSKWYTFVPNQTKSKLVGTTDDGSSRVELERATKASTAAAKLNRPPSFVKRTDNPDKTMIEDSRSMLTVLNTKKCLWNEQCKCFLVCSDEYFDVEQNKFLDVSGYGNHADLKGRPVWRPIEESVASNSSLVSGIANNLLVSESSHLVVAGSPSTDILDEISIEVWARVNLVGGLLSTSETFLVEHAAVGFPLLSNNRIQARVTCKGGAKLMFETNMTLNRSAQSTFKSRLQQTEHGEWHHFALTFSGKNVCIYVDGQRVFQQALTSPTQLHRGTNPAPILIARDGEVALGGVRIWNVALDQGEVFESKNNLQEETIPLLPRMLTAPIAHILVRLLSAENFMPEEADSIVAPYAEIVLENQCVTSRVIQCTGAYGEWNDEYKLGLFFEPAELEVQLWNHRPPAIPEFLGRGTIRITKSLKGNFLSKGNVTKILDLKNGGRVRVELKYVSANSSTSDKHKSWGRK